MKSTYVVDTCALISYFSKILIGSNISISKESIEIIDSAFYSTEINLIFPSTVFIELFKKWFRTEEDAERIKTEIYLRIFERENMEIQPFDKEVLENFIKIKDIEPKYNFDNHDKQILAAAMTMECALITSDTKIIRYNKRKNVIPYILD
ncbi:PIN domain-containing protein [Winogradskyella psychrotolerans]|uniref:PIN domain-containing protein n=1 Tax=Winogradskyella psychrotolerans TaxID=1344585 RepID=UPI001C069C29|nr:PIN domain-containing protein [Winogradskyella psychrotolerans]MBU2929274.1 PIN domain-containing protein [Winogradskyella psychrotolerans]